MFASRVYKNVCKTAKCNDVEHIPEIVAPVARSPVYFKTTIVRLKLAYFERAKQKLMVQKNST